jgi:hypothetical protein
LRTRLVDVKRDVICERRVGRAVSTHTATRRKRGCRIGGARRASKTLLF